MHDFLFSVGVKVAARNTQGAILLLQRSSVLHMPRAGGWDLPGGAVEHGEQPLDAMRRELREETGLEMANGTLVSARTYESLSGHKPTLLLGYAALIDSPAITLSSEHDQWAWTLPENLRLYDLPERYIHIIGLPPPK